VKHAYEKGVMAQRGIEYCRALIVESGSSRLNIQQSSVDNFVTWFKRQSGELDTSGEKKVRTEGLWVKCESCRQIIWKKDLEENLNVCPKCEKHFRIDARTRLALLLDDNQYETFDANLTSTDPLGFVDLKSYASRLEQAQTETGLKDAVINARGKLNGRPVIVSAMEYAFIGGSMGAVVGEAITRAIEQSIQSKAPLIIVSASGGARMMEGVVSLMQLAKISAALARLDESQVPYISVLTDPTTGGVTASFSMLGDLNIAEPGALIGFAGPRVIEQTIRQKLPPGFQRSEFLLEHGMLDAVVPRKQLKPYIGRALEFMTPAAA
jgi:acetyl-CoA carboxylase carboxyl transferase subunit beta